MTTVGGGGRSAHEELLRRAYAAYDEQDADALLRLVGEDVDWPDDGAGRLHGRAALRAYWLDQWTRTHTHDEPLEVTPLPDGRVEVRVEQVVRALDGSVLSTGHVVHRFGFDGDVIGRLDIEPSPASPERRAGLTSMRSPEPRGGRPSPS